jgi:IclR family acetate operon transcriptional repressor
MAGSNIQVVEQKFQTADQEFGASSTGTQAIDRAAALLRLVLESEQPLGVGDLAREAGLPKSTASRLLSSLARHGLVHRAGARGKVQPGPAILRFAHRGMVESSLIELAKEPMEALSEASGETVNLAVAGQGGVEHIAQVDSRHFLGSGQWIGRTVPYERTAVGKVLVAHGAAAPPRAIERPLADELQRCRRESFAMAVDQLEPGLTAMAAPVHGPTGDVIAALSLSGPTLRLSAARVEELRPLLIRQARALSAKLGYHEEGGRAA